MIISFLSEARVVLQTHLIPRINCHTLHSLVLIDDLLWWQQWDEN